MLSQVSNNCPPIMPFMWVKKRHYASCAHNLSTLAIANKKISYAIR